MPANEFTAIVDILPGKKLELEALLKQIGNPLKLDNTYLQFAPNTENQAAHRTHFARMVILPGKDEEIVYPDKADRPSRLLFSVIFDGFERSFFEEIVSYSPELNQIWALCVDYTPGGNLYGFLQRHRYRPQLFYSAFLSETVESITKKTAFRNAVQVALDHFKHDFQGALDAIYHINRPETPHSTDYRLSAIVDLVVALIGVVIVIGALGWIISQNAIIGGVLLIALLVFVALIGIPILQFLVIPLIRPRPIGNQGAVLDQIDSIHDAEVTYPPSMLTAREDVIVQNQFNLYLTFEGDDIQRAIHLIRMIILMFVLNRRLRIIHQPGSLGGLTTVHFGHWVLIDGGRRLFFMTNYDGSWENYIADFVNKIYEILDVQLLSFVGFGKEGTRNIAAFRRWLRLVQLQSDVFYSAYPHSTVRNITRDLEIARTFPEDRNNEAANLKWIKLLGDPHITTTHEKPNTSHYRDRAPSQPALPKTDWNDIQSIIVYGYANLPHGRYLFLHIDDPAKAKIWLGAVIPHLTTVADWENDDPARTLRTALNIAFTHPGMAALELPAETLSTFSREFREGMAPIPKNGDELHTRSINLGDTGSSSPLRWTVGNRPGQALQDEIHIMLLVNGANAAIVDALLNAQPFAGIADATAGLRVIRIEQGMTPASGREPFGFRDGVSNPWIEGTRYSVREANGQKGNPLRLADTEIRKYEAGGKSKSIQLEHDPVIRTGEFILGYMNEYDQIPATPMICAENDPTGRFQTIHDQYRDFGRNGSYLVYRKLAQDVENFWSYLATDSGDSPAHTLKRAAKLVGRWTSGTPLVLSPDRDDPGVSDKDNSARNANVHNNFRFRMEGADDSGGMRCPFGSHTRRSHPRDGLLDDHPWESYRHANQHRLIRRSAAFGRLPEHAIDDDYFTRVGAPSEVIYTGRPEHVPDEDGVGIHFLCINANIQQQFEFVQQTWNNNGRFNGMFSSKDPITGNHADRQPRQERLEDADKYSEKMVDSVRLQDSSMTIPVECGVHEHLTELPRFVTVRGGAYLFLPSLTALHYIVEK